MKYMIRDLYFLKRAAICSFVLVISFMLTACGDSTPILDVIIQSTETDSAEYEYLAMYDDGKSIAIEEFKPNVTVFVTAVLGDFVSHIENGKIRNTLEATRLIDRYGNEIEADDYICAVMQAVADSIDHDIIECSILTNGDRYFAFVKLNVNLTSPCILYEHDQSTGRLTQLCHWDSVDLIGISVEQ